MRNILELTLLRLKRLDIVARSPEVRRGGQGVFTLHTAKATKTKCITPHNL